MPLGDGLKVTTNIADELYDNEAHRHIAYKRNQQDEIKEYPMTGRATPLGRNRMPPLPTEQLESIVVDNGLADALDKDLSTRRIKSRKKSTT